MPCEYMQKRGQTPQQREAEVTAALAKLEAKLETGSVQIRIGPQGAVALDGWEQRDGVTDVCAVRRLDAEGSWEWRQALARAESMSGRKMSLQAVGSGTHSHDGGATWHRGH